MTDLKSQSVWICWQYETDKDGRPTKIPYNAKTGGKAMSNNRQSWSDYQTAFSLVFGATSKRARRVFLFLPFHV